MLLLKELPDKKTIKKILKSGEEFDASSIITVLTMLKASSDILIAVDKYFAANDLSHGRFSALSLLERSADGLYPNELADGLGVSRATASTLLKGLEKAGLVQTAKAENDGRMKKIVLTKSGREVYEKLLPQYFTILSSFAEGLGKKELKSISEMMQTFISNSEKIR